MTQQTSRAYRIQKNLDNHFLNEVQVAVAVPEPSWWWERYTSYGDLAILGWAWPQPNFEPTDTVDSDIIVPYCPQVIDEITEEMSDEVLEAYLTLIKYVIDLHIVHWDEYPPGDHDDERHKVVVDEMTRDMPVFARLLNEGLAMAQLRWLTDEWEQ